MSCLLGPCSNGLGPPKSPEIVICADAPEVFIGLGSPTRRTSSAVWSPVGPYGVPDFWPPAPPPVAKKCHVSRAHYACAAENRVQSSGA
eukprot:CAMPEP_0174314092 /NCGR_PEP_ID=MMETSP0810-20121108/5423_1 /TAXON_ID=73025 ORGANISM="Eutreptiella gymnastica-like, Strain CCMP1594" /NCGR_SAMPLE_ID=MMETSP0810 /ASSEMBLY_ACC=CAM_ASM_000659 /LENGTH=88 /DNA_ID=CAMNT_0015423097 /DNA_START=1067 /DNA_END=1333 /DNA_ORIENTATION=+